MRAQDQQQPAAIPWPVASPVAAAVVLERSQYSWTVYLAPDGQRRFPVLQAFAERAARAAAEAIAREWDAPLILQVDNRGGRARANV